VTALAIVAGLALLLAPAATSQTFQVIHNFTGGDGEHPYAGLTMDAGGKLYGTTAEGGRYGYGTVFQLTHKTSGWVLNVLYNFQGGSDGELPTARVVFGPDGVLYGTTFQGGNLNCGNGNELGCGVVFSLQPPATYCKTALCPWTKMTPHAFAGTAESFDGQNPVGDLTFDSAGNIYGVTNMGGQ